MKKLNIVLIGLSLTLQLLAADYFEQATSLARKSQQWPEIYKLIDENKININEQEFASKMTLLDRAIIHNNLEATQELLNRGAETNIQSWRPPLMTAIGVYLDGKDNTPIIKLLLEKGADPNIKNTFGEGIFKSIEKHYIASNQRKQQATQLLKELLGDESAPQLAISPEPQAVSIAQGVPMLDTDDFNRVFNQALKSNKFQEALKLIDKGKININEQEIGTQATLLGAAIIRNNLEAVQELLNRDAETNIQSWRPPLHRAIKNYLEGKNSIPVIKLLLERGANPNIKNTFGEDIFKLIEEDYIANSQRKQQITQILKGLLSKQPVPPVDVPKELITITLPDSVVQATGKENVLLDLNENEAFTTDSFKDLINEAGTKKLVIAFSQDAQHNWYFHVFDAEQFTTYSGTQGDVLIDPINRQQIKYITPLTLTKENIQ